jgi:hypothetical protein
MSAARLEAERVSNALGSWLDAIIADRQRRHAALR